MNIRATLRHRADVQRSTSTYVNGVPTTTWSTVAVGMPCLLDTLGNRPQETVGATETQITEARKTGMVVVANEADVRPSDRLAITVAGRAPQTYSVMANPSHVDSFVGPHHRELRVKEV